MELKTNFLGKKIQYFEKIDSTQLEIFRRIEKNTIQNGELIVSDIQTQGKRNAWKTLVYTRKR